MARRFDVAFDLAAYLLVMDTSTRGTEPHRQRRLECARSPHLLLTDSRAAVPDPTA